MLCPVTSHSAIDIVSKHVLTISDGIKIDFSMSAMRNWYSEVDPAIWGHREPHVVRVGVDCILSPR